MNHKEAIQQIVNATTKISDQLPALKDRLSVAEVLMAAIEDIQNATTVLIVEDLPQSVQP